MIRLHRHRGAGVLGLLLLAQLMLLGSQLRAPGSGNRLIQHWAMALLLPAENVLHGSLSWTGGVLQHYVLLAGLRRANQNLQAQVARLRLENRELAAAGLENERLRQLLGLHPKFVAAMLAADVIGVGPSSQTQAIYLDRGRDQGVKPGMPVIAQAGVVGKISRVMTRESQVLFLTDPSLGAGATNADGSISGVLRGAGVLGCRWEWIRNDLPVKPGELLFTSGQDRIFPPGLPLGRVVSSRPGNLFLHIRVQPLAHLMNLRQVMIVTRLGKLPAIAAGGSAGQANVAPGLRELPSLPAHSLGPQTGEPLDIWDWQALHKKAAAATAAAAAAASAPAQTPIHPTGAAARPGISARAASAAGVGTSQAGINAPPGNSAATAAGAAAKTGGGAPYARSVPAAAPSPGFKTQSIPSRAGRTSAARAASAPAIQKPGSQPAPLKSPAAPHPVKKPIPHPGKLI